jgi:hypothetical protein
MDDIRLYIALSGLVSLMLLPRVWRNEKYLIFKILISVVTLIPFVGPLLYLFVSDDTPPQAPNLQNRGPRGEYTHNLIGLKSALKRVPKKDDPDKSH